MLGLQMALWLVGWGVVHVLLGSGCGIMVVLAFIVWTTYIEKEE